MHVPIYLILTTPGLVSDLGKYFIWEYEYGSGHRAIRASFWVDTDELESRDKLLFKNARPLSDGEEVWAAALPRALWEWSWPLMG